MEMVDQIKRVRWVRMLINGSIGGTLSLSSLFLYAYAEAALFPSIRKEPDAVPLYIALAVTAGSLWCFYRARVLAAQVWDTAAEEPARVLMRGVLLALALLSIITPVLFVYLPNR